MIMSQQACYAIENQKASSETLSNVGTQRGSDPGTKGTAFAENGSSLPRQVIEPPKKHRGLLEDSLLKRDWLVQAARALS